ncbi:MAG TPA: 2-oxoacid:acceptor oxidoreductase subunit alpha [Candidatus Rokubacteria bacterium]|nr:MAG: 2-oxoglutarate synthase subunit alpha [Candidatus Rokubacteria bacterium GWA2_73_35]HBH03526.1 2-oxoacid:acceptor oxidoreductase subunit alpha [Candidatus Rokubacteria bacterium]
MLLQGNEACARAAVDAGCRFYAGYPITPSSEIAERMAELLPPRGGVAVQMEDEIASLGAVLGASLAGRKAMTATSGPGFSLMQEHVGYAASTEIPCVVVDVMRAGPSTGLPTSPAQGDVMQARWGTHGDHPIVALAPASVAEVYELTVRAFNLAERYRTPVVLLWDEVIGHVRERVMLPDPASLALVERARPSEAPGAWRPYAANGQAVPAMADFGSGHRWHVTGLAHDERGYPTQDPAVVARLQARLHAKLARDRADVVLWEGVALDDAEVVVVAFGVSARAARRAVGLARRRGARVGLFRPRTLWPFPDREIADLAGRARALVVAEMNMGQIVGEVERAAAGRTPVTGRFRADGQPLAPEDVLDALAGAGVRGLA